MKGQPVVEVENLSKHYGRLHAVDGVSFQVEEGSVFAFLGPNGAGKTTTVEMLEMIRTPTSGTIRVLGRDLGKGNGEVKKRIGVLPQDFRSFGRLTVRETLLYYQKLYDGTVWDVDDIIRLLHLETKEDTLYMDLSGGLRQRVGVGMSLVNDPDIIFLDEPTTGLDPRARREVWDIIRLLRDKGKTVFLTTHYMEEAEELADSVCIIHRGKIIARGTPGELITSHGSGSMLRIIGCEAGCMEEMGRKLGIDVEISDGEASMAISDTDTVMSVLSYMKEMHLPYREVDIQRSSLEEVFLSLTGERLGGGGEDAP
jgi:ABC-2 type transport system ATP-binding protein